MLQILFCSTGHVQGKFFASFDGLAFGVLSELFSVPVLRKLTNEAYELLCVHGKDFCESVGVIVLSATATRLFSHENPDIRCYPCFFSSLCKSLRLVPK